MLTAFRLNVREVLIVGIEVKFGACTLSTVDNFGQNVSFGTIQPPCFLITAVKF
jgi:hypothetical protein